MSETTSGIVEATKFVSNLGDEIEVRMMKKLQWLADAEVEAKIDTESTLIEQAEPITPVGIEPTSEEKVEEQAKEEITAEPSDTDETEEVISQDEKPIIVEEGPAPPPAVIHDTGLDTKQIGMIAAGVALIGAFVFFMFKKK